MALLIDKSVDVLGGIPLNQLYLRIRYFADLFGKSLNCTVFPYPSKAAFSENWQANVLSIDEIKSRYDIPYDSSVNGDPLLYLHNYIKSDLSTDKTQFQAVLDPSTGFPTYDPSTGDPITEEVVVTVKFAMDASISFADLD